MPPQSTSPTLYLQVQPQTFFLIKMDPGEPLPTHLVQQLAAPLEKSQFLSITRTKEEVSVVSDFFIAGGSEAATRWLGIRVAGPMDLGLTGIMNDLTTPLKAAKIPIFALSTWNTDFLLVPVEKGDEAVEVMRADGWVVERL